MNSGSSKGKIDGVNEGLYIITKLSNNTFLCVILCSNNSLLEAPLSYLSVAYCPGPGTFSGWLFVVWRPAIVNAGPHPLLLVV